MVIKNGFEIQSGYDRMDFDKVTRMLAQAFWSPGIGIDEVKQGARHSAIVIGVFAGNEHVGYARVISDRTRFAYILDVYGDEKYRRQGIGQLMINTILNQDELKDVYQWLLIAWNYFPPTLNFLLILYVR